MTGDQVCTYNLHINNKTMSNSVFDVLDYYLAGGSQVTLRAEGDETAAGGETASGAVRK